MHNSAIYYIFLPIRTCVNNVFYLKKIAAFRRDLSLAICIQPNS